MKTYNEFLNEAVVPGTNGHINLPTGNNSTVTPSPMSSMLNFKTLTRMEIITVVSLMLDSINQEYMRQHNGLSLWGTGSISKRLKSM